MSISPKYLDIYVEYINTTVRANSFIMQPSSGHQASKGIAESFRP